MHRTGQDGFFHSARARLLVVLGGFPGDCVALPSPAAFTPTVLSQDILEAPYSWGHAGRIPLGQEMLNKATQKFIQSDSLR